MTAGKAAKKPTRKQDVHLICNAHLDPVWMWEWEEGAAEAISTFRTAVELCEKDEGFVFNHNEVTLYKWVQEYEPGLFKRIQKQVKAGRWHIMGGMYLQPDCNMPSGESFVRQILLGKSYFKNHFGVDVTTAINFDPFGHTRGLVQILAKSGYDSYMFGRPDATAMPTPYEDFVWVGYDGSEVMACRFAGWYNSPLGRARSEIEKRIALQDDRKVRHVLWGVGNHGGGPSRHDLREVNKLIAECDDYNIVHSTPEAMFKAMRRFRKELPRRKRDINAWAAGCYTSQIRIKQKHRKLENEYYAVEKMATTAALQGLVEYPREQFHASLCDLMVTQFHDILPGSSIALVEESALGMMGHALEELSRIKARAFFALAGGQAKAKDGEIPVLVYNPHPFSVKTVVECEFQLPDQVYDGTFTTVHVRAGKKVLPCQVEQELGSIPIDWRKRIAFVAELEPGQMNRFDCRLEVLPSKPAKKTKAPGGNIVFKSDELRVVINTRTGLVDQYRVGGVDMVGPGAFAPIVMMDDEDPWGMRQTKWSKVVGRFRLMSKRAGTRFSGLEDGVLDSVRVIEDGAVRTMVEAVFACGDSFVCQRYKLPKVGTEIEVETRVHWNEKNRMLKLEVPTRGKRCRYLGQVAYGVGELPGDGHEAVSQKWVAVVDGDRETALTCINDGVYGSDFSENGLRLTLLRSPAYSAHPIGDMKTVPQDRYTPRIDQGERVFRFWFNGGPSNARLKRVDREALVRNEWPMALSFFPPGGGRKPKAGPILSDGVVQLSTMKLAEKNGDVIVRLFEPTGRTRSTVLTLPTLGKRIRVKLDGFEIKTLRINRRTGDYWETDLMETRLRK